MCGRYYVDDDTVREIRKLVCDPDEKLNVGRVGDIHPSELAVALGFDESRSFCESRSYKESQRYREPWRGEARNFEEHGNRVSGLNENGTVCARRMRWGFPGYQGKGLLINARAESVLEKPVFRDSILHRRCVIPAAGFYEWNRNKEKSTFYRSDRSVLWMAGCFREYHGELCFVILTTKANESVAGVHERMPLILERQEAEVWIRDDRDAVELLDKTPCQLEREQEYEQMSLF